MLLKLHLERFVFLLKGLESSLDAVRSQSPLFHQFSLHNLVVATAGVVDAAVADKKNIEMGVQTNDDDEDDARG